MLLRIVLLLLWATPVLVSANEQEAWDSFVRGDAFILMRHALAPGVGDPQHFLLDQCNTQRNLNAQGREEARAWGELLRNKGAIQLAMYSSRWCRSLETAEKMEVGEVIPLPLLDSFFQNSGDQSRHTSELKAFLMNLETGKSAVLVTHQVNITALTGLFPRSGEALIIALPFVEPPTILARVPAPRD